MAATSQAGRVQYRSNAVKMTAVAKAAEQLLDLYTWENTDGRIQFTTEPNPANISSPELFDHEVKSAWAGLRAALIVAGVITGESTPGFLPGNEAQFLRVQTWDLPTSAVAPTWRTRAVFEVATGVNSYGYADGAALDLFYALERGVTVRVLRQCLAFEHRADYLRGDVHSLTSETVIGQIDPFSVPNVASGWAVIGDMSANPEPDLFGLESPRLIVIPLEGPMGPQGSQGVPGPIGETGLRGLVGPRGDKGYQGDPGVSDVPGPIGPQGPAGPMGPIGPQGLPGTGGGGEVVVPPVDPVPVPTFYAIDWPTDTDVFALVRPLYILMDSGRFGFVLEQAGFYLEGGIDSAAGEAAAVLEFIKQMGLMPWDQQYPRSVTANGLPGVLLLCNVSTGRVLAVYQDDGTWTEPVGMYVKAWLAGPLLPDGYGTLLGGVLDDDEGAIYPNLSILAGVEAGAGAWRVILPGMGEVDVTSWAQYSGEQVASVERWAGF
jgi:hypothetical protein